MIELEIRVAIDASPEEADTILSEIEHAINMDGPEIESIAGWVVRDPALRYWSTREAA